MLRQLQPERHSVLVVVLDDEEADEVCPVVFRELAAIGRGGGRPIEMLVDCSSSKVVRESDPGVGAVV